VHRYRKALPLYSLHDECSELDVQRDELTLAVLCKIAVVEWVLISGMYVGSRYASSGASKYDGMQCMSRFCRISGNPMMTSIQLSITLASIYYLVISFHKVKSNTTVPYTELV